MISPTPWKQHSVDETLVVDAEGGTVAHAFGDYDSAYERMEADARLIAAAPDLYDALKALANHCFEDLRDLDRQSRKDGEPELAKPYMERAFAAIAKADAAIAKAEGTL